MSRHNPDSHPSEMFFDPGDVPRDHDQDTLGQLRLLALGRSPNLQVLEVGLDLGERSTHPRVISVPRLCNLGVGLPLLPD